MKKWISSYFLTIVLLHTGLSTAFSQKVKFNDSWLFYNQEAKQAETLSFDDSQWRSLDLPHDWAIEGPFDKKYNARCGGLPFHGTGWYRKHFTIPNVAQNKIVRIEFEGAMYDAHIWVNGQLVGNRPYGYIGFEFEIGKYLKFDGSDNVIAVRLTPKDLSSRWYPGAGLYRSVWLKIDEPQYIDHWGTYITTPTVNDQEATIQNETVIVNQSDLTKSVTVKHEYYHPDGKKATTVEEEITLKPQSKTKSELYTKVVSPKKWDIKAPHLYTAITTITDGDQILDSYESVFGIRTIRYDLDNFYLNGRKVRFQGVCLHHDNGSLGTAVYRRAIERKLQIMKKMGVNAVRTSHNPPSRELLELCDELGILVQVEAFDEWKMPKVPNGYHQYFDEWSERDLKDIIRRDRNHPSVIMWSIGNEILEQRDKKNGWKVAKQLHGYIKEMDPTRPTTAGFNYYPNPYLNNLADQVDIAGVNYKPLYYQEIRQTNPSLPIYGSETSSCTSSRGVYHLPIEKYNTHPSLQVTSYDLIGPIWAYPPDVEFHFQKEYPHSMGEFIWTGFDYLGEPTPYGGRDNSTNGYWNDDWPARSSYFGTVDLCGFPKDRFYLYQSQWTTEPMIHLLPHWNWSGMEGQNIPVYCYTNCEEAELFVNGKSMGRRKKGTDLTDIKVDFRNYQPKVFTSEYRLSWEVPYEKGLIQVVGYINGQPVQKKTIHTAGKPYQIKLSADRKFIRADSEDLAYVTVEVLDKQGNLCPKASNLVHFDIKGSGQLIAVDNGDATSTESFQASHRKTFNGMALVILKSTKHAGKLKLTAKSKGLKEATVSIETKQGLK